MMTRNAPTLPQPRGTDIIISGKAHWAFIVSAALTLIVCVIADNADAANARSGAGLVTNNQTYTGFGNVYNDGSRPSADRSDVHTRPLAIDNSVSTQGTIPDAGAPAYAAPAHTTVLQQGHVVTTVREEATPPGIAPDSDDVNARSDAGVIITHPVTSSTPVLSPATGGVGVMTRINP